MANLPAMLDSRSTHADTTMTADVPSPIDLRRPDHAREWTEHAMAVRPWRADFFDAFVDEIGPGAGRPRRVLELGSGPGFLASRILQAWPDLDYVAVDFSAAMHELSRERLGPLASRARFVERNLRDADWGDGLGPFDAVVTHQAVHELRHKQHAPALHRQVRQLLAPGGLYLVCDHFLGEGGMKNDQLYMTVDEQREALAGAGFAPVEVVLLKQGLVLHRAVATPDARA